MLLTLVNIFKIIRESKGDRETHNQASNLSQIGYINLTCGNDIWPSFSVDQIGTYAHCTRQLTKLLNNYANYIINTTTRTEPASSSS